MAGAIGASCPNIRQTCKCVRYYIRLRALLYLVACTTILARVTLVRALVYCNFLREVRLGGWGSEGPKGLTLGQYVSACANIPLGSGRI